MTVANNWNASASAGYMRPCEPIVMMNDVGAFLL